MKTPEEMKRDKDDHVVYVHGLDEEDKKAANVGYGGMIILLSIPLFFLNALYFKLAWGMVIVPFFGANTIGYWQSMGLLLFINTFLKGSFSISKNYEDKLYILISSKIGMTIVIGLLWLLSWAF